MVDLSKAKAGDTVKFRCGGEAVIKGISVFHPWFNLSFEGGVKDTGYYQQGKRFEESNDLFDITEVIPAPEAFDWGTVKVGMAFTDNQEGDVVQYVGDHIGDKSYAVVQIPNSSALRFEAFSVLKKNLTRSPEHDIKESV
jgi:hypothetical protein